MTSETIKLLRNIKKKIAKDKNGENVPHLEISKVNCYIVKNNYQQNSRFMHTIVPNKLFNMANHFTNKCYILKAYHSEIS